MAKRKGKRLFTGAEWDEDKLRKTWDVLDTLATKKYGLTYYEPQFEITNYETMLANQSATGGVPGGYSHWSFGRSYLNSRKRYKAGKSGLAYELIINTDPSIVYIMDTNTMEQQALVMAHAAVGHSAFFKNNYMFKYGVSPKYILPFMKYANNFIGKCEDEYNETDVSILLDMCHSLQSHSIDRAERFTHKDFVQRQIEFNNELDKNYNEVFKNLSKKQAIDKKPAITPEENFLYFIEKNSPILEPWEREVCRIVRIIAQYFYPQGRTKLMNEGYATFWEYILFQDMYNDGYIDDGTWMEFMIDHTSVASVPNSKNVLIQELNPYKLGFMIFMDIKRICEDPTDEDKEYFPELVGTKWEEAVSDAMENYNDSSFIAQYLSPTVLRKLKLAHVSPISFRSNVYDDTVNVDLLVNHIHSDECFLDFRSELSKRYRLDFRRPEVIIKSYDPLDNVLEINYNELYEHHIHLKDADEVSENIRILMGMDKIKLTWNLNTLNK